MAQKRKNSNYVTAKTVAKREQALKDKRNAKIKRYALISVIAVLITACVITGLVFIALGINKNLIKKESQEYDQYYQELLDEAANATAGTQSSKPKVTHVVTIPLKGIGDVEIELYGEAAPIAVENFLKLYENNFYDDASLALSYLSANYAYNVVLAPSSDKTTEYPTSNLPALNIPASGLSHVPGALSTIISSSKSTSTQFVIETNEKQLTTGVVFGMVTKGYENIKKFELIKNFSFYSEYTNKYVSIRPEHDMEANISYEKIDGLVTDKTEAAAPVITHTVELEIENYGTITIELYGEDAPYAVQQFVELVNKGFYDGKKFTQAVANSMFLGGGTSNSGVDNIKGNFNSNGIHNPIKHERGTISFYRSSVSSSLDTKYYQFFIVPTTSEANSIKYDGYYSAFGKVTEESMAVIDAIMADYKVILGEDGKVTEDSKVDANGKITTASQPVLKTAKVTNTYTDKFTIEATHKVEIEIENYGKVELELYGNNAPITVEHFIKLVKEGYYDGMTFHRAVEDFMIQGGCPKGDGTGNYTDKDGKKVTIEGEFYSNGFYNAIKHKEGVISMARGTDKDSASCQFFIVHETSLSNTTSLDGNYAAFGKVTGDGMTIIDKIFEDLKTDDFETSNKELIKKDKQPKIISITVTEIGE